MQKNFHLSIVATSRNDNHGGSLTKRMQHFVDGFVAQCIRHDLQAELILVEWNPPPENVPLKEVLRFPKDRGPSEIRIITVPRELHDKLKHAESLPLFQMIGKNVGIRRALGNYVLATNIDILFSDAIMQFLKKNLDEKFLYRTDRVDIPSELPENSSWEEILHFAEQNAFRINGKNSTVIKRNGQFVPTIAKKSLLQRLEKLKKIRQKNIFKSITNYYLHYQKRKHLNHLHTNACGDFTLLSKQHWQTLRGYPEWEMYSWHIDSILLYQAHFHDIPQMNLPQDHCVYHIEHHVGSGFTPENANALFDRLRQQNIGFIDDNALHQLFVDMMEKRKKGEKVFFNAEDWGWRDIVLHEEWV